MWGYLSWFLCILIGFIPAYLVYKKDKKSEQKYFFIPTILRGLSFFLVAMLLLAPPFTWLKNDKKKPIIVWLQDNSSSIKNGLGNNEDQFLKNYSTIKDRLSGDYEFKLINFGSEITEDQTIGFKEPVTNIENALTSIFQRFKNQNLGAIILPSDGIYNEGNDPRYLNNSRETPIYSIALGDSTKAKDKIVLRTFANKILLLGNSMEVAVDVRFIDFQNSTQSIQLLQNGQLIQQKSTTISEEDEVVASSFELKPNAPGLYRYSIAVPISEGEQSTKNNILDFYVEVISNDVKILLINGGTHPDIGVIRDAIKTTKGYQLQIAKPNSLPANWQEYKLIIAHQPNLSLAQWKQMQDAQKAIWYLVGNNTTSTQLQAMQPFLNLQSGGAANFYQPTINKAFSNFKLPLSAVNVLSQLPPLESNVVKVNFKDNNNTVLNAKNGNGPMWITKSGNEPLAITIGEGLWRWNIYEYKETKKHEVTNSLIQQTISVLNVPKLDKPFVISLSKRLANENENISLTAELRNKTGQLVNDAVATLNIQDSLGNNKSFEFDKMGESYQLLLPPLAAGNYSYVGAVNYQGKNYTDQGSFVVESMPLEQIVTQADYGLMYQLAQQSNGKFYTLENMLEIVDEIRKNENIKTTLSTTNKSEPFIHFKWLFGLILTILTIEWLLRKYWGMM